MCFNYKVSIFTFAIGLIFSILLIKYGNIKYKLDNTVFGIFGIFISFIQLMDFIFWIDLKNTIGINKIATILGPLLNVGQPVILYIIKLLYYTPNIYSLNNFNLPVAILNLLYIIYLFTIYVNFLFNEKLVTGTEHNHLKWPWIKYSNPYFYLFLFAINIFYLTNFKYSFLFFIITYLFLYISVKYFYYNAGELWCFFGSFIPFIMYGISFNIDSI